MADTESHVMNDEQPSDPRAAGAPRATGATRTYENEQIRVLWDATRCTHTAICLRALPTVFDVNARPWIDLTGAPSEKIAETVRLCPTGALRYQSRGELSDEKPAEPTQIEVRPNGPLLVRGRLELTAPGGRVLAGETRVALCRCGASQNKPFCDNSHRLVRFHG